MTIDWGAATGSPFPTMSKMFEMDGSDASSQLTGDTFVAQEGQYYIGGGWSNSVGSVSAAPVELIVQAPPAPSINYDTQLIAYFNADTPITGTDSDVLSLNARGTGGVVYSKTGTGTPIERIAGSDGGFKFSDGAYLQSQNLTGMPTTDGLFAVVSFTLTSYGSNQSILLDGAGGHLKLRNNGGSLQFLAQDDSAVTMVLGSVVYSTRFTIAGEVDDVTDVMRAFNMAGSLTTNPTAHTGMTDPELGRLVHGRYVIGTIHEFGIVGKPEGGDWPVTMEELYADFTRGA